VTRPAINPRLLAFIRSHEPFACENPERKEAQRSTGDNSTMTPRIFRVGLPWADMDDGLSVTQQAGTVAIRPDGRPDGLECARPAAISTVGTFVDGLDLNSAGLP